ncbi:hypothetical protein jhhlp_003923 [Lomentospora prolificans]|uniref:Mediator of RNA polymerase II transcription subunit 4 n=1 Tax=Lomentospora prolificans TaxID=41688 RepID=A0A2N3NA47_9PEZI|nr:hypothetical protein jhhlp_003923 [Lomentospora prolificans]
MDKAIDSRFERLERALAALIDSVAKYNPSATQARDLENADHELSQGLDEVQAHQNNYLRIQKLREESRALDDQIRECLTGLASTRKDVLSIQTTVFPTKPGYAFTYGELLNYARRISKTTMPPPGVTNGVVFPPSDGENRDMTPVLNGQGVAGSAAQTPSATQPATPLSQQPSELQSQQLTTSQITSLPENLSFHLNPHAGSLFFPWPLEDKIRSGALSSNQLLEEQGIDPKNYDPVAEEERKQREEEEKRQREEEERIRREEQERKVREERERAILERAKRREEEQAEGWRKSSVAGASSGQPTSSTAGPGEKKQFQFTSIDDMDDED